MSHTGDASLPDSSEVASGQHNPPASFRWVESLSHTQLQQLLRYLKARLKKDIILDLPPKLTRRIFRSLDPETLCIARQVSRTWRNRATDNALWEAQCNRSQFPITPKPTSFLNQDPESQDDFYFQLYKHYALIQNRWNKREFSTNILSGHKESITCLSALEKGETVYSGSVDKTIKLWHLPTGKNIKTLQNHTEAVQCLVLSQTYLASGSWDKTIFVYNVMEEHTVKHHLRGHLAGVISLAIHPNETVLFSGSVDKYIRIWDLESGQFLRKIYGHDGTVSALTVAPRLALPDSHKDQQQYWLVSGSNDQTIVVWDLHPPNDVSQQSPNPKIYQRLEGHTRAVTSLVWRKDVVDHFDEEEPNAGENVHEPVTIDIKNWIAGPSTQSEDNVYYMDLDPDQHPSPASLSHESDYQHNDYTGSPSQIVVDPVSSTNSPTPTAMPSPSSSLPDYTLATNDPMNGIGIHTPSSEAIYIYSSSVDCTIQKWDLITGRQLHYSKDHSDIVWDLGCNSSRLVSVSSDGHIKMRPFQYGANSSKYSLDINTTPSIPATFSSKINNAHQIPCITLAHVKADLTCVSMSGEWLVCGTDEGAIVTFQFV